MDFRSNLLNSINSQKNLKILQQKSRVSLILSLWSNDMVLWAIVNEEVKYILHLFLV